jgi:hypothetical protein
MLVEIAGWEGFIKMLACSYINTRIILGQAFPLLFTFLLRMQCWL